jgi:transposase
VAFEALIARWAGILVSDGYGVYQHWMHQRQTCLAHLIRRARGLEERKEPEVGAHAGAGIGRPVDICRGIRRRK